MNEAMNAKTKYVVPPLHCVLYSLGEDRLFSLMSPCPMSDV